MLPVPQLILGPVFLCSFLFFSSLFLRFSYDGTCESLSVVSNSLRPHGLDSPWNSPGQNSGVGSYSLLQGILSTQGSNAGLSLCSRIPHQLSYQGMMIHVDIMYSFYIVYSVLLFEFILLSMNG